MAWLIVKQPNGLLARFSAVNDTFTSIDMTEQEALDLCCKFMSFNEAKLKVLGGVEDWKPWLDKVKGSGHDRWDDCMTAIKDAHGDEVYEETLRIVGDKQP